MHVSIFLLALASLSAASPVPADTPSNPTGGASVLQSLGVPAASAKAATASGASGARVAATCQILGFLFPQNETFSAQSSYYTPIVDIPWSQTCWLTPGCIVTPKSSGDLSKVIRVLSATDTKFAVRSAGHTVNPGFNGVGSDGVLVALQYLNQLSISADQETMTVGSGNRWNAVYALAGKYKRTIAGGREPMVGVGGYLLGGGLSAFYNTVGLGLDSVKRYEVVLTSGEIVNATATENADLFKALKGGLTNMGIVTTFDLMTYPYYDIYIELYLYSGANTPALLTAYANYLSHPNVDPLSQVAVQVTPNFTIGFYGYIGKANRPSIFNEFYKIPVMTTFAPPTNGTFDNLIFGFYGNATSFGSSYSAALSHKVVSPQILLDGYQTYLDLSKGLPSTVSFNWVPQGVTPNLVKAGLAANPSGNLLGIQSTPQVWNDIYMDFRQVDQADVAQRTVDAWYSTMTAKAQAQGIYLPYQFVNNANAKQAPLKAYGAQSFQTIKQAAAKWDPKGVMQGLQNAGFLVSNES